MLRILSVYALIRRGVNVVVICAFDELGSATFGHLEVLGVEIIHIAGY